MRLADPTSPVPLYHQVATVLRRRIADGQYSPEHALPSEAELGGEFAVSRATIRQAVGELVEEGLVSRGRGRGTVVLARALRLSGQRFRGSLTDLIGEVRRARVRSVNVEHDVEIPLRVAGLLLLDEPRGTVVRRTRVMDGIPFAYTVNFLPEEYGALLSEQALRSTSLLDVLEQQGVPFTGASQSIRAEVATEELPARLELTPGAPVLFVERVMLAARRRPVEVVRSWYRGDAYEYTVELDLKRHGGDKLLA